MGHVHKWKVVSVVQSKKWILLDCKDCEQKGVIEDPTDREWEKAYKDVCHSWKDKDKRKSYTYNGDSVIRIAYTLGANTKLKDDDGIKG